jgi:sulfate permease, SulP family
MVRALRNVGGGLIASLLLLASAFSNGALIFTGPLEPFLGQGVAAALITTAVTTIFVALTSNFPSATAGPVGNTAALLAAMMITLAPALSAMSPGQALALAIAGLGGAALITGLALFLLGWKRLGKLIRFVPYPVVAGFLAATGWLIISGAIRMATDVPISRATLLSFAAPHTSLLFGTTVLWAAALWLLTARIKGPLTLPLALVAATVSVHGVFSVFHLSEQVVRQSGLMFSVPANSHPVIPLITGEYFHTQLAALWPVAGDLISVAVMAILAVLLNSTVLELSTGVDADIDRELRMQGLANVASALAGGFVGTVHVTGTLTNRAAGGTDRLSGVVVGLVALAVLIAGGQVVGYVPRFVLGGLLLQLGAKFIWDWGVLSRRSLPLRDWLVVLAIVLITAERGFLEALLFGVLAGCVIFAVDVSRVRVVRHQFGLDERTSSVIRSTEESALLAEHGGRVQVLELAGYLFFGSAYSVQERVTSLVTASKPTEVIFDFSGVTGIDSSAGACFAKIRDVLRKNGARQVMAALSPAAANILSASAGLDDRVGRYDRLDEALEEAEEMVLAAHASSRGNRQSLAAWLQEALGAHEFAEELCTRLTPAPRDADSYLCRQGDPTDSLIFVERGPVTVILERPGLPPVRARVFGSHTLVGEIGFFLDVPRSASLLAAPDAVAWSLCRDAFESLKKTRSEQLSALFIYIIRLQSERLTFANRQILALQR